jgi:hypothetical protein
LCTFLKGIIERKLSERNENKEEGKLEGGLLKGRDPGTINFAG